MRRILQYQIGLDGDQIITGALGPVSRVEIWPDRTLTFWVSASEPSRFGRYRAVSAYDGFGVVMDDWDLIGTSAPVGDGLVWHLVAHDPRVHGYDCDGPDCLRNAHDGPLWRMTPRGQPGVFYCSPCREAYRG